MGGGRMVVFCFDPMTENATTTAVRSNGFECLGIIRGSMRKRVWMTAGDFVLVGIRDFQREKCDILHKYDMNEVRKLKVSGELPETGVFFACGFFFREY
jgi:translation initiation factor 1A